jgi:hypothetical protein
MRRTALGLTLIAAISAAACLQKDTTSTIYLRPDGSFDWVVFERNVRSDEADAGMRQAEEVGYADEVNRGEHDIVNGLLALGAEDVEVRWLRSRRPYAVMIDARFDSLAGVFGRMVSSCGIPFESAMAESDGVKTWTFRADVGVDGGRLSDMDSDCVLNSGGLDELLDGLRIVHESGTFMAARGFILDGKDTVEADDEAMQECVKTTGIIELSLSWR